jgi:PleD family two-component response regulator
MMILYDFEVVDYPYERELNELTEKILSDLRVFVMQRFKPLADEMALEEQQNKAFAVIYLLDEELYGQIQFIDYSDELAEKLKASLTDDDVRYIHLKILEELPGFRN